MGNKPSYPNVDLSGKVAIVTGGNTGIGYETAKGLVKLGAHTFIACRSKERAQAAIERMKSELGQQAGGIGGGRERRKKDDEEDDGKELGGKEITSVESETTDGDEGGASDSKKGVSVGGDKTTEGNQGSMKEKLEYLPLDLASLQSTTDFVRLFKEKSLPLHILVNNAGIFGAPFSTSDDGLELHFQVNHLGHLLLTLELLPVLLETAASSGDGRIVIVSSDLHYLAQPFDPNNLSSNAEGYKRIKAYNNSKLYNVMMGFALQRRLQSASITVSSLHPGVVETEVPRTIQDMTALKIFRSILIKAVGIKVDEGAVTTLNCAVNPDLNSQQHFYYSSCQPKQPSTSSMNEEFQEELWRKSVEFLKDHLSPETMEKFGPSKPLEEQSNQQGEPEGTSGGQEGTH